MWKRRSFENTIFHVSKTNLLCNLDLFNGLNYKTNFKARSHFKIEQVHALNAQTQLIKRVESSLFNMCTLHYNIQIKQRVSISSWVFFLNKLIRCKAKLYKNKENTHTHTHMYYYISWNNALNCLCAVHRYGKKKLKYTLPRCLTIIIRTGYRVAPENVIFNFRLILFKQYFIM